MAAYFFNKEIASSVNCPLYTLCHKDNTTNKLGQGSSWYKWYTPPDCACWHIPGIWQSHFGGAAFLGNQWGRGHLVADYYKKPYNRLGTLVLACAGARAGSVLQTAHSIHPFFILCLKAINPQMFFCCQGGLSPLTVCQM